MGLGDDGLDWDVKKKKGDGGVVGKKKKKTGSGCWIKFRFICSCVSSRSKVDSSVSGLSSHGK